MKMKKAFLASLAAADEVVIKTALEAKELPNMLGQICSAALGYTGWYSCQNADSGVKTLYVLPENEKFIKA